MINEIPNAVLIIGSLLLIIFAAIDIAAFQQCKHKYWAQYHSKKCRVCIDCGKIEPMESHL